jgi:hypothetical protein
MIRVSAPYRDKGFHHPVVGDVTVTYEVTDLPADAGRC